MSTVGTVKFFNSGKGYRFISPDNGGTDAFVHITAVERAGMQTLNQNQRVSHELEQDKRGKTSAINLRRLTIYSHGGGPIQDRRFHFIPWRARYDRRYQLFRNRAAAEHDAAQTASLSNVRERCERAERAWT